MSKFIIYDPETGIIKRNIKTNDPHLYVKSGESYRYVESIFTGDKFKLNVDTNEIEEYTPTIEKVLPTLDEIETAYQLNEIVNHPASKMTPEQVDEYISSATVDELKQVLLYQSKLLRVLAKGV